MFHSQAWPATLQLGARRQFTVVRTSIYMRGMADLFHLEATGALGLFSSYVPAPPLAGSPFSCAQYSNLETHTKCGPQKVYRSTGVAKIEPCKENLHFLLRDYS